MYLIRDVFRCKPGKAAELAERFKKTIPSMRDVDGFRGCQILVDAVASYWTVVLQTEVDNLSQFERHMETFRKRPEVQQALQGYMDLVEGGYREIFRLL